jgi:sugar phosphate isomerase/epimerase
LGIVIYCLNFARQSARARGERADLFEPRAFLDHCHGLGAGGVQVPLGTRSEQEAAAIGEQAARLGMFLEGIVSPPKRESDLERFEAEIRTAARAGARAVRTVIIPGRRYERFDSRDEFREFARRGRQSLLRAAPIVERHRVRLAVENHKDQRVEDRVSLLREISSEYVGACVDTGNSFALLEDPLAVVQAFAPWAMSVHLKDQAVREYDEGFLLADVALGDGFLDLPRIVSILREIKPDVRFSLETITRDPLRVPCLTDRFWGSFENVPARDLARTLRTARVHAADQLPQVSGLSLEEQAELERAIVNKCLAYARDVLEL